MLKLLQFKRKKRIFVAKLAMKKILILFFVGIALLTLLYRGLRTNPVLKNTKVVVVAYYTEPCEECPALEHTIRRLAWFFGREPIDFYAYNPANQPETAKIRAILQEHGIWQQAQKDYLKGTASIFTLKNKQKYASFKAQDDLPVAENLVRSALK